MFNNWYRKERPIQGMMGMGGGATGYLVRGVVGGIRTNDADPFGDNSCMYTYQFNGNSEKLGGGTALSGDTGQITVNAAKFGSHGFNGTGSSRLTSNDASLRPSANFSINFWYRSSTTGQDNDRILTVKGSQVTIGWNNWNNRLGFYTGVGSETTSVQRRREIPDGTVNDGNWHQITGTVDTGGNNKLYLDGSEWTNTSVNNADGRSFNQYHRFCVTTYDGGTGYNATCNIDQIRVFNKVLTANEVALLNTETD